MWCSEMGKEDGGDAGGDESAGGGAWGDVLEQYF